ncbi:MAG: NlpC/P60 family protein [Gammaproteobacteria bacterium]|nr:NlpC/P60 family protein [Gammaproteobacteria bacterium]
MYRQLRHSLIYSGFVLFVVTVLSSCAGSSVRHTAKVNIIPGKKIDLNDTVKVRKILKSQHHEWKSVKHRLGGLSKQGVDCSGLVYVTYLSKLGIRIPRSTELQSSIGEPVKQKQLKPGDLVFFKTGLKQRHVGIYMGDKQFLHASSSKGVTVSSLANVYWGRSYWKARRIQF